MSTKPSPEQGKQGEQPVAPGAEPKPPAQEPPKEPAAVTPPEPTEAEKLKAENERLAKDYGESTREAQTILGKNKQLEKEIEALTSNASPTDEEMQALYSDWELLSEGEKDHRKRTEYLARKERMRDLQAMRDEAQRRRDREIGAAIASKPELQSRASEFRAFCDKPTHVDVPADVLVSAFLHETAPPPTPPAPPEGAALGRSSGGPKDAGAAPEPELTAEQLADLRTKDPQRYLKLVRAGKVK
jgi:hypothetical protein